MTPERTLEGTYFRSDEHMAHYEVTNSVGSFEAEDMDSQEQADSQPPTAAGTTPAVADTMPEAPVRQAATRHKATTKPNY